MRPRHSSTDPFGCDFCPAEFPVDNGVPSHIEERDADGKWTGSFPNPAYRFGHDVLVEHVQQAHPSEMMTCGRRYDTYMGVIPANPGYGEQHKDWWEPDGSCSYCGSISPGEFWRRVTAGYEVIPTDKNYKAYVRDGSEHGENKFYFQHFGDEDKRRFIEAVNDGSMRIGYPGHFYRLPFFCARVSS
jgi:hypothetical protein